MRLFISIQPPPGVLLSLKKTLKKTQNWGGVRWVSDDQMHLTLKFLGEVSADRLGDIQSTLQSIQKNHVVFNLYLNGAGVFPNPKNPRVFWVGLKGESEKLLELAKDIEVSLGRCGFPIEKRDFKPHLTVGRLKQKFSPDKSVTISNQFCTLFNDIMTDSFVVEEFSLVQSRLGPVRAEHEVVQSYPLGSS